MSFVTCDPVMRLGVIETINFFITRKATASVYY